MPSLDALDSFGATGPPESRCLQMVSGDCGRLVSRHIWAVLGGLQTFSDGSG